MNVVLARIEWGESTRLRAYEHDGAAVYTKCSTSAAFTVLRNASSTISNLADLQHCSSGDLCGARGENVLPSRWPEGDTAMVKCAE